MPSKVQTNYITSPVSYDVTNHWWKVRKADIIMILMPLALCANVGYMLLDREWSKEKIFSIKPQNSHKVKNKA